MEIPAEIRQAHAQLSKANERFLDFVQKNPELLDRSAFEGIEHLEDIGGYALQAWPTFISSQFMAQIHSWNKVLCHLVKVIPHRLFGNDVGRFAEFYELQEDHAQLVVATYANPRWVDETMARGDFMLTTEGFKCMEYNLSSRLGGWHSSWATEGMLELEPVRRFAEKEGLKIRRGSTFKTLMGYLVKRGIQRFSSREINIAALFKPGQLAKAHGQIELFESMERELRGIEGLLGGKVQCRLLEAVPERLEERGGQLYLDEHRIHAVLEGAYGHAGLDAMRCWLKGTVDLYNGPATPVMNDKRNLALLSELEDSSLLDDAERKVVKAHMPWTRRVSTDRLHDEAVAPVSREEILRRREELVLKPSNLSSGQDVFLGPYCEASDWEAVLDRAYDEGNWLVQEILESPTYYFQGKDGKAEPHDLVWGVFLYGDKDGGPFLRLGPKGSGGPINAHAGASLGVTVIVDEGQES